MWQGWTLHAMGWLGSCIDAAWTSQGSAAFIVNMAEQSRYLDFIALFVPRPQVEKLTTRKKSNLILNVDGTIGTAFVDLLRYSGESVSASLQLLASVHLMSASSPYSHSGAPPSPPPPGLQASSPERRPRNTSIQASSMASLSSVVRSASSATFLTKRDCSKGCIVTLGMIFATCCPLKQSSMSRILS